MKTLNKIILTGLSVLSLNNLYSQEKNPEEKLGNSLEKISLKQLIFEGVYPEHSKALEKYTPITKQEIQSDTSRFNMINSGLKEYLNKIYIINQNDFFDSIVAGHIHPYGGILCLSKNYILRDLFHELAHIRHHALNDIESDFSKKWERVANFEYGENNFYYSKEKLKTIMKSPQVVLVWKDGTIEPKNGCLVPYSAKDIPEDIATFIECLGYEKTPENLKKFYDWFIEAKDSIIKYGNETSKYFLDLDVYESYFPLYFADTTDHRYQKKLDLLKEYDFLTKEEHEKLSKNLGSLSYLLKK